MIIYRLSIQTVTFMKLHEAWLSLSLSIPLSVPACTHPSVWSASHTNDPQTCLSAAAIRHQTLLFWTQPSPRRHLRQLSEPCCQTCKRWLAIFDNWVASPCWKSLEIWIFSRKPFFVLTRILIVSNIGHISAFGECKADRDEVLNSRPQINPFFITIAFV